MSTNTLLEEFLKYKLQNTGTTKNQIAEWVHEGSALKNDLQGDI